MQKLHLDTGSQAYLNGVLERRIEARLFNAKLVASRNEIYELASARKTGLAPQLEGRSLQQDAGSGHGDAVFVHHENRKV